MPITKDNFTRAATLSIMERSGVPMSHTERDDVKKIDHHMRGLSLHGLMGAILFERGLRQNFFIQSHERGQVVQDFMANYETVNALIKILTEVQNRNIHEAYTQAQTNHKKFCNFGTVKSFKNDDIVSVSPFARLALTADKAALTNVLATKKIENITLGTHTGVGMLSRAEMYGDNMEPFITGGKQFGIAAAKSVNDAVFKLLISNPALSDTFNLFSANHNNLALEATSAALTPVSRGVSAMMNQTSGGVKLNIPPKFIIVHPDNLIYTQNIFAPVFGTDSEKFEVLADANLDNESLTGYSAWSWYLAADPKQMGTLTVFTLEEFPFPAVQIDSARASEALGIHFKLIFDFGIVPDHYAGLYKNNGSV